MLLGEKNLQFPCCPGSHYCSRLHKLCSSHGLKKKRENTQRCKKSDEAFIEHEFANEITFVFGENTRTLKIRSIFSRNCSLRGTADSVHVTRFLPAKTAC